MSEATSKGTKGMFSSFESLPNLEVPAAFREFAEKGAAQTREVQERIKAAANDATDLVEQTFKTASASAAELNRKVIENSRLYVNAAFDHAFAVLGTKSFSEALEVSAKHVRKQFETVAEQTKELATLVQKLTAETAEPVKEGIVKTFKKSA